jgi:hypothetical protein
VKIKTVLIIVINVVCGSMEARPLEYNAIE